jgi:hypothetical protein
MIAVIDDGTVARGILDHLGLPSRAPPRGRPWSSQRALPGVHEGPFVNTSNRRASDG